MCVAVVRDSLITIVHCYSLILSATVQLNKLWFLM